jgi:MotA/TolQ/ExbB proton channel family
MHPFRLLTITVVSTAAAAAAVVVGLADVLGAASMLTTLALVVTVASAVHHHLLFRAMDAAAGRPGASLRSYRWAIALPYVVFIGLIFGAPPLAFFVMLMAPVAGSGSGGIGSVSAGVSEALVETLMALVVALPVVLLLARYVRRSTNGRDSQ